MLSRLQLDKLYHPLPSLETERLVLSPVQPKHAEAMFQVLSDPQVMTASKEEPHASVEVTAYHINAVLKRHEARTGISWVLFLKEEQILAGQVSLHSISWPNRRGDFGFDLMSRHWRRGLMSEAMRAVIEFSFSHLAFVKLCAQNTTDNHACHSLLLSLGFEQEGLLRRHGYWNDSAHDLRQYGLIAPG